MNATISPEARQDLLDILGRIRAVNPFAAEKMEKEFSKRFRLLSFQPGLGTRGHQRGMRVLPVEGNYRIVYREPPPLLEIQRVIHTARNWPDVKALGFS